MLIAAMGRPAIRKAVREALRHLPEVMDVKRAKTLYTAGRWREIADTINWGHFREVLKAAFERIAQVFEAGARHGTRKINAVHARRGRKVRFQKISTADPVPVEGIMKLFGPVDISKAIGDRFNFDRFDRGTQDLIRQYQDDMIAQLETGARDTIEAVVLAGAQSGLGADAIVDDIRAVINLTDRQAQAVLNYRRMVTGLDSGALQRQLRDTQFDSAFAAAQDDGTTLDAAVIDEMVSAYEENYLNYRADSIAQTESVRASNAGIHEAYRQAIDRGALPSDAIRRFWQTSMLENVCPVCLSIPDMNQDGVEVGADFDSIDGPQGDPPDPHPLCACSVDVVTDLDKVPDDTTDEESQ